MTNSNNYSLFSNINENFSNNLQEKIEPIFNLAVNDEILKEKIINNSYQLEDELNKISNDDNTGIQDILFNDVKYSNNVQKGKDLKQTMNKDSIKTYRNEQMILLLSTISFSALVVFLINKN
tara:strand:- start:2434 stop:2799 length:366 start_codon:yes stop_codon:yes gene_type:complete